MPAASYLRVAVAALVGLWAFFRSTSTGAAQRFYLSDFHDGRLRFDGLERNARDLVRAGFALLIGVLALVIADELLRERSELLVMGMTASGRASLAPALLVPLTLFLLVTAWTFALTGALHCRKLVAVPIWALFTLSGVGWVNSTILAGGQFGWQTWTAFGSLAAVATAMVVGRRLTPRPTLEFSVLFPLVAAIFLIAFYREIDKQQRMGLSLVLPKIEFNVNYLQGLVTPMLLLIGVGIADFTRRISHWAAQTVRRTLPPKLWMPLVAALSAWLAYTAFGRLAATAATAAWRDVAWSLVGAAGEIAVVFAVYAVVRRFAPHDAPPDEQGLIDAAARYAFPLAVAYSLVALVTFLLLGIASAAPPSGVFADFQLHVLKLVDFLGRRAGVPWHYLLAGGMLLLAVWLLRRGRTATSFYLALIAASELWLLTTRRGGPLERLYWENDAAVELGWLLVIAAAVAYRLARREGMAAYRMNAPFLLLMLTFMRQRDFIENPFSPLLGSAGAAFVAFGLLWDVTTQGRWANGDGAGLPRLGRLMMYLGYALLAATILNWSVAVHDLDGIERMSGGAALVGFDHFGKPLLYGTFALLICRKPRR